jgi:hypothetical protein
MSSRSEQILFILDTDLLESSYQETEEKKQRQRIKFVLDDLQQISKLAQDVYKQGEKVLRSDKDAFRYVENPDGNMELNQDYEDFRAALREFNKVNSLLRKILPIFGVLINGKVPTI